MTTNAKIIILLSSLTVLYQSEIIDAGNNHKLHSAISDPETHNKPSHFIPNVRLSLRIAEAKRDMRKTRIYRSILRRDKSGLLGRP